MSTTFIYLNNDLFEVDVEALQQMEANTYVDDPFGTPIKDWIKITEWIEAHGRLVCKAAPPPEVQA